jgi:hypothetical protein
MRTRSLALTVFAAALALTACADTQRGAARAPVGPAETALAVRAVRVSGEAERPKSTEADVTVRVELRAPLHARYDSTRLAAARSWLGIQVFNHGASELDVSDLRAHLEATREGVSFGCKKEIGPSSSEREPSKLAPGASFVFERALDCALPLAGKYAVRVSISFGSGAYRTPRAVRATTLTVTAPADIAPKPLEGHPGLYAAIGANPRLDGGKDHGVGRMVVSLVSARKEPSKLPSLRLALRVYRVGQSIPCEDEPVPLREGVWLGPGESHFEPIEVSCLGLGVAGSYDVEARLLVPSNGGHEQEMVLGKLRIDVVTNQLDLVPPTL